MTRSSGCLRSRRIRTGRRWSASSRSACITSNSTRSCLLTDILHAFAQSPVAPAYDPDWRPPRAQLASGAVCRSAIGHAHHRFRGRGILLRQRRAGAPGLPSAGAHRARSRHQRAMARIHGRRRLRDTRRCGSPTAGPTVEAEGWNAPGYWREIDGAWMSFTLGGLRPVDPDAPSPMSATTRPTPLRAGPASICPPRRNGRSLRAANLLEDAFGIVWQWTRSAYSPYPGYRAADGALGEYNGKFMINQMVLARQLAGNAERPRAYELPQFLLSTGALAVQRPETFGLSRMSAPSVLDDWS